jgi:Fe-Mn family superoxide dismutase
MPYEPLKAKPLPPDIGTTGISRKTHEEHYKLYTAYVTRYNEIMSRLAAIDRATANQTYSEFRELKVELTVAVGGVKNHELYFEGLTGTGGSPTGAVAELIERDFGSLDAWKNDFKATGIAARGWVWLALDHDYGYLFNYLGDAQNTYPVWNATPILALDTDEHAYYYDYQASRGAYIDAFFNNLNWEAVNRRLKQALAARR